MNLVAIQILKILSSLRCGVNRLYIARVPGGTEEVTPNVFRLIELLPTSSVIQILRYGILSLQDNEEALSLELTLEIKRHDARRLPLFGR